MEKFGKGHKKNNGENCVMKKLISKKGFKQVLSLVLVVCLLFSGVAFAATDNSPGYEPTDQASVDERVFGPDGEYGIEAGEGKIPTMGEDGILDPFAYPTGMPDGTLRHFDNIHNHQWYRSF